MLSTNISGFDIWARVDMENNNITNDDTESNIFSFDDSLNIYHIMKFGTRCEHQNESNMLKFVQNAAYFLHIYNVINQIHFILNNT